MDTTRAVLDREHTSITNAGFLPILAPARRGPFFHLVPKPAFVLGSERYHGLLARVRRAVPLVAFEQAPEPRAIGMIGDSIDASDMAVAVEHFEVILVPVAGAVALGTAESEGHRCDPPLRLSRSGMWPLGGNRKPRGLDDPPWDKAHGHHDNMPVSGELFHTV